MMHTSFSTFIRKIFLGIMMVGIAALLSPAHRASIVFAPSLGVSQRGTHATVETQSFSNETFISKRIVNAMIPLRACFEPDWQAMGLPQSRTTRERVPGAVYVHGCGAVSGAITSTRLDRAEPNYPSVLGLMEEATLAVVNFFPNLYTGPTNGGVMPLDNSPWPTWTDRCGDIYPNNPLVASHMGVDGRTTKGTIDDYWDCYLSNAPDPYITGNWIPHAWGDAIGDYMYTSQSAFGNNDGETGFWLASSAARANCAQLSSLSHPDGTLGTKQFYQARGYAVGECYNQLTNNIVNGGFSFAQFKAEIDAGWPVLLGLQGHTVLGVGYNSSLNLVYLYNGWDNEIRTMEWKENCYAPANNCSVSYIYQDPANNFNLRLEFVSIVHIVPGVPNYYTISGNAGAANATILYTGGNTTADANGNYAFTVSESWFGTVSFASPCYTFNPPNRNYANVTANHSAQNYTATINTGSGCSAINVLVAQGNMGSYGLQAGRSLRVSYVGVDNGPAKIASNGTNILAALRVIWREPGVRYSYSEMMGLPKAQLSNEYWFPWYNNAAPNSMDQGFRIANVDTTNGNTVEVWVGTTKLDTITLGAGGSTRVSYNVDDGPIRIVCTTCSLANTNDRIIAALRVIWKEPGFRASYSEMLGLPAGQLSNEYWFPWYNNAAPASMDQGFRIANVDTTAGNTVEVWVGTTKLDTIALDAGGSTRVAYGVDNGPIRIFCTTCSNTGSDKIIAALRVIWKEPGFRASYSEMLGLPKEQLSNTYWFPWYNNAAINSMDQGFRIANVDTTAGNTVEVWVGTTKIDTIILGAGGSTRVGYNIDNGPIRVVCTTCSNTGSDKIIVALRVIWKEPGYRTSYSEMMGMPAGQLSNEYWFPWYNNAATNSMDQGFRIAVP